MWSLHVGRGCEGVMLGGEEKDPAGWACVGNWNYNAVVARSDTDCEVCMQSTMKLSVVKVAPGGPAWLLGWGWGLGVWPGAHPL